MSFPRHVLSEKVEEREREEDWGEVMGIHSILGFNESFGGWLGLVRVSMCQGFRADLDSGGTRFRQDMKRI
jgi:hypothetical protein